jgi:hypothetical protein
MLPEDVERGEQSFLLVERLADSTGQTYVQSARSDVGTYLVEYCDGTPDEHFGTNVVDMRAAHALIASWDFEDPTGLNPSPGAGFVSTTSGADGDCRRDVEAFTGDHPRPGRHTTNWSISLCTLKPNMSCGSRLSSNTNCLTAWSR